jgi:hypothetical protein
MTFAETFAITDVDSGNVVQGELSPRNVKHQVRYLL